MRINKLVPALVFMVVLVVSNLAFGQQGNVGDLAQLQSRTEKPNAQQQLQIDQWIGDSLDQLADAVVQLSAAKGSSEEDSKPDLAAIRDKIARAARGSENYSIAFVGALDKQVTGRMQGLKQADRTLALNLTMVLAGVKKPQLTASLVTLMGNDSAPVRYWAAKGLLAIGGSAIPDSQRTGRETIAKIVELGKREQITVVLSLIYQILSVPGNAVANDGVVQIMDKRVDDYLQGQAKATGADLWAVRACENFFPGLEKEQKMKILTLLTGMFKAVVEQC